MASFSYKKLIVRGFFVFAAAFLFFGFAPHADAATLYYNNAAADGDWRNPANWWGDADFTIPSSPPGSDGLDDVILEESVTTDSVPDTRDVASLTINDSGFAGHHIDIDIIATTATFNGASYNNGTITGSATFNNSTINYGTINGGAAFHNASYNANGGEVSSSATFDGTSHNAGSIGENATFSGASHNTSGSVVASAEFDGTYTGADWVGAVSGQIILGASAVITIPNGSTWDQDSSGWTNDGAAWIFNGNSTNTGYVVGSATFNDTSSNSGSGTVESASFFDSSHNVGVVNQSAGFHDDSTNAGGSITGDAVFNGTSYSNDGWVGMVGGTVTLSDPDLVISVGDEDFWTYDTSAWIGASDVQWVFSGTGQNNSIIIGSTFFNDSSVNTGDVSGPVEFHDLSYNQGSISSSGAKFYEHSYNDTGGTIASTVTFYDSSHNNGSAADFVTFNGGTYNNGTVYNALFNATSSNSGGNVTNDAEFNNGSYGNTGGVVSMTTTFDNSAYTNSAWVGVVTNVNLSSGLTITIQNGNNWNLDASTWSYTNAFWEFHGSSVNQGTVSNVTFLNTSSNTGTVIEAASFYDTSYNSGGQITDATFNDYSYNNGAVTNVATFGGNSFNDESGSVGMTATFNDFSYNHGSVVSGVFNGAYYINTGWLGTVSSDVTLGDTAVITMTGFGDWNINATSWTINSAGGHWVFQDSSINSGIVQYAIFQEDSQNYNSGAVTHDATFYDNTNNNGTVVNGYFHDSVVNNGTVSGDATFYGSYTNLNWWGTVSGAIILENTATINMESGYIWFTSRDNTNWTDNGATWTFNSDSYIASGEGVSGNAIFLDSSHNEGTVAGNAEVHYPVAYPLDGSVGGSISYIGYTLGCTDPAANNYDSNANADDSSCTYAVGKYFNGAIDGDWNNTGNWWGDSGYTQIAGSVPGPTEDVFVLAPVTSNGGPTAHVNTVDISSGARINIEIRADNIAVFHDTSYIDSAGTITGTATFYDASYIVNGATAFAAIFNDNSHNNGTVTHDATFNGNSVNNNLVSGNATFTGTYTDSSWPGGVTGTVTLGSDVTVTLSDGENWSSASPSAWIDQGSEWTFNGTSFLASGANVSGDAVFNDTSYNAGTVFGDATVNYPSPNPLGGAVHGSTTYVGYIYGCTNPFADNYDSGANTDDSSCVLTGHYFNAAQDGNWNNLGNWWTDDTATHQANALPGTGDDAIINAVVTNNSGPAISIHDLTVINSSNIYVNIAVSGVATFSNGAINSGALSGNAVFNSTSNNSSTITGNVTFNGTTYSVGLITGDATFNDESHNEAMITGDAAFADTSYNNNTISSDATFHDSSYNSGNITGNADVYYPSPNPIGGTVNGTITYHGYASNSTPPVDPQLNSVTATGGGGSTALYIPPPVPVAVATDACKPGDLFNIHTGARCSGTTASSTNTVVLPSVILFERSLSIGMTGTDVQNLQKFLNALKYTLAISGPGSPGNETMMFGSATKAALIRFQAINGIPATGFFGPITRAFVNNFLQGAAI